MFKLAKIAAVAVVLVSVAGFFFLGSSFPDIVSTVISNSQDAAESAIPAEFQLKRIESELKDAQKDISDQGKRAAVLSVDCQDLERDLASFNTKERTLVTRVRYLADAFESTGMGVRPAVFRGREVRPGAVSVELRSAAAHLKELRRRRNMKTELLDKKRETLVRAQEALYALKDRHSQLTIGVESCRTNIEYVRLIEADLGSDIESNHFKTAETLLTDLDHRVRVKQEHGKIMSAGTSLMRDAALSNEDMVKEARALTEPRLARLKRQ